MDYNKEDRQWLHGKLQKKGYDVGSYDEFEKSLQNKDDADWYYKKASDMGLDVGTRDDFESLFISSGNVDQKASQQKEDDAVFNANAERFRNGQPTEKVTTQSMIDAHPELGLQTNAAKSEPPKWNVPQYDWKTDQQKKIEELSNSTTATPVQDQYGNEYYPLKPREVVYDEAVKGLKDISERKAETKSRLQTISNDVSNELNRLQSQVDVSDLDKFRPANLQSMPVNPVNQELMPEYTALRKAQRLVEESNNIIEEASKKGNTNFMAGLARGFWDNLNAEDYTFGADDAAQSAFLYRALDKAEKGESLTKAEETLLDAAAINMAVQSYYAQDLGKGYGAGQVTAESIPFMLEMAINPISASGKTTAKALLNYGLKKFAKNKAAKVGARLAGDALAATGMAATTGFGDVLEGTTDRLAQNYNYQLDDEGRLHVEKKDDAMGMGEAFARSFATRAIENQSEMIFKAFEPIGGFMKGVQDILPGGVNKFFEMLGNNKVADAYRTVKNSPVFRNYLVKDIRNAAHIGGLGEEYLEEVYNNLANAAIGEMKWEDVVSLDKNIDTLLGLAPTQVMFCLLGLGGAGAMRYQTRRTLEDLQATMNEQQRKDLEGLLDMGLDAKEVDVRSFIRNVMNNQGYTIENKRDLIKAAYNVAKQNGIDELTEADTIDKVNAENSLIDSVTDPSTGIYTEITATLPDAKEGTIEVPGYVVGWLGEGEKRQPIFVQEGMENTYENRRVLKPGQWSEEAVQQMPAEEVKALNEEMIREEATQQAEQEAKYAPEVLNAQMQQGVPFNTPTSQIVPVAPMLEGNGWVVEEYALETDNKVAKTPIVRELTNDEYRAILQVKLDTDAEMQRQLEAQESVNAPVNNVTSGENVGEQVNAGVNVPVNNENVQPVAEGVATEQQSVQPKQPTLEEVVATLPKTNKGEIDYKSMTPQQQYQYTSITESPEVALEDLQADIAAGQEEIAKIQEQLTKARGGQRAELRDKIKRLSAEAEDLKSLYQSVAPKQEQAIEAEANEISETESGLTEEVLENGDVRITNKNSLGEVATISTQRDGKIVSVDSYDDGILFEHTEYDNNGKATSVTRYDKNGSPIETVGYVDGKREIGGEETKKSTKKASRSEKKPKLTNRKKQKQSEFTDEELQPMDALEFAANNFAAGNVAITTESFKKETGYGESERKKFMGLLRTPEKGGMTIEEAAEKLVSLDNEGNGQFFGNDTQEARNAIIELLGLEKWGDVTGYIKNNRLTERKKREEAEYAEYEAYIMEELHVTPEEYELLKEAEEQRISELYDVIEEVDAIFAEAELERQNNQEYEQGRNVEGNQGQSELLSEARTGDLGGNQRDESQRGTSEVGGTSEYNIETPQESASGSKQIEESLRERAKDWGNKLGVKVNLIESIDQVTNREALRAIQNGQIVTGWFEESTGEVCFYMPYLESESEIDSTYIHEVVAHKGLRGLLGNKFDAFCDEVWESMSIMDKAKYMAYPGVNGNKRAAADEYIAHLAENIDVTDSAWSQLTELIKKFLKAIGLEPKMTNADIANTVKKSYQRLLSSEESAEGSVESSTRFKAYKSKDGKETKYKQLSLFGEENEAIDDRTRPNNLQREGDSTIERLNHLRELQEGEICNVERKFTESKEFSFTRGEKIESTADVAYIFKSLEDEAVENSFVAITNGDNVSVFHLGMGAQTETVVDTSAILAAVDRLDADKVFFVHNHPSGMVKCSRQDVLTYQKLKDRLGDKLQDGIIINTRSGKYGLFNSSGLVDDEGRIKEEKNEYPLKVYKFNKQSFNVDVIPTVEASSSGIAEFVSTQRLGKRDKVNALLLNNQFGCVGNILIDNSKNMSYVAERITNDAIAMGARQVIIYGRYPFVEVTDRKTNFASYLSSMINGYSQGNVNLIDIIQIEEPYSKSANDEGVRFRTVYHGSAADFNKFDRNFSGSGEGQAVMGAGHYVTTSEGTGRYYAEVASDMRRKVVQEGGYTYNGKVVRSRPLVDAYEALKKNEFDVDKAIESIEHRIAVIRRVKGDKANTTNAEEAIRLLNEEKANKGTLGYQEEIIEKPARHLYEVEIPDDNGKNYFDLDKKATKKTKDEAKRRLYSALENSEEAEYWKKNRDIIEDEWRYNVNTSDATNDSVRTTMEQSLTQEEVADILSDMGYVGSKSKSTDGTTYIIYKDDSLEIKSNTRFRVSNRNQEIFVSNAQNAVESIKQEKGTPQQWLAMIEKNGGLKAGEDKWLDLSDWLKASGKKSITKAEILDFINQNKIVIEEVHYGGKDMSAEDIKKTSDYKALAEDLTEYDSDGNPYISKEKYNYLVKETFDFKQGFKLVDGKLEIKSPYAASLYLDIAPKTIEGVRLDYTTKGLENKAEIALTVPTIEPWNVGDKIHFGDAGEGRAIAWVRFGETTIEDKNVTEKSKILGSKEWWDMSEEERKSIMDELKNLKQNSRSTRVLVIDEIQSKRHQEGREKGYATISEKEYSDKMNKKYGTTYFGWQDKATSEEWAEYRKIGDSVPSAPFEKNWSELAFKRMLRYAAENGFDKVAWTTGEQQAERYNLGNVIDSISISKSRKEDGKYHITSWDKETMPIGIASGNKTPEELKDLFGKEIAQSLIEGVDNLEDGSDTFVLEGADLEVGGEGMKGFYDKMLPSFVNKYVKKWGTKVQDIELPNVEEAGRIMHSVDVTDAMKESVMEGQTIFRISEKGKQIQAEVDKFTSKYNSKPVSVVDSEMTDEELEEAMPVFLADDTRKMIGEGKLGSYSPKAKRIFIFADNNTPESLEDTLFHENLHTIFADHPMIEEFFNDFNAMYPEQIEMLSEGYEKSEIPEEVFVSVLAASMQRGNFKIIDASFSEDSRQELYNTLKEFGYDYEQESRGRIRKGNNGESSEVVRDEEADERNGRTLHEDGSINRTDGRGPEGREKLQESEGSVKSATERKERLTDLFNKVADMGLQGVLGNKNYTSLMVDIYKALPEEVRAEIADDALRLYGGSIAPAVSDYIGPKSKNSIMDKVVTIVREALRKVGFDLDLNANEVRYMAWRSKKPLDRNNLLEMAEDIDMKYRLKVGEYDGTTPDGGGTRFRVTPKMDAEYLEAVNSGDNKKVAKLVKDAAKAAMPNTKVVDRWGKPKVVYHGTISPERFNEFKGETIFFTSSYADANLYSHKREGGWLSPKQSGRPLSFFLNIENPLVIDAKGRRWSDIPVDWTTQSLTTDDVAQYAKDNGYDGVIINKVKDSIFTDMSPMTVYIAFSSNQIKDAGTTHIYDNSGYGSWRIKDEIGATYDDNGNVIPLSERFNPEQKDIRFRVSGKLNVRDEYEATIKKGGYQAREAVQDAMLSLRKFQEMIEKATGKKIRDFENAWMHENRLSSVVQAEIHDMERKFYKPMMDAVKKLMSVANLEQEQVADYLMLKHGIERNREMAVRKALTDDKGKIDRTKLEQWYQEKDAIRNDATLDTWRKKQEAMDNAALNYGADMSHDYSGLTSMFGTDDLADSTQKAYDEVEALENAHPVETESLGKAIKAMTQNTLEKSFESGLMDRKVYDELSKDMYDYYIPLRGFEETTSEEVYAYLDQDRGAFNAPLKRAKGRSSKSDNPIAYLKSIAESGIMQGNRNKMKQSFLNMVINNPSDLVSVREGVWVIYNPASGEWEAASAPAIPNNATPADVEVAMEAWEQQMEQAALKDPTLVKKVAEAADVPYRVVGNKMDQHQVVVKRLGKSYTLTVNGNPRLAMALNGQTNPNNTSNDGKVATYVNNKIGALNRSLAAWYTTRNPDFVASNFMRDTFYTNTIVRAKEGNAYANKFHKNYAMALPKMLSLFGKYEKGTLNPANKTEADFLDFMMNGGETGYSNLKDVEEIKKQIAKELKGNRFAKVEALAEKLDILNRAVENTARFAAYLTSREEGRSIAKSIFDAKEISVNFNKKGAGGTFFGMTGQTWFGNLAALVGASGRALYVFFNAAIQGSTNLMHVMKVNPKGTSAGLAAMFLMGAIVPFLFGDDDDEKGYYDLPEHVRRNHLIIPGTGDAWISIPLPIEYRIMYGIGELLTSWRTGHERGSDIARKMLSMSGQALPLNFLEEGLEAFVPSAVSPIYQVMTNSSWTGLPIYKENDFNKDDPEYTKAYSNVDRNLLKLTKALYEWTFDEENQKERIDLNPAIIETLAKGYFGGLATQLSNIAKVGGMIAGEQEFDWRNIPIGNRVLKTGDERTKEKRVTNEYFENMEKLDFLQSRERMLKKTEKGVAVPEADKSKAQKDLEAMQGTEVYKKYQEFKKQKKVVDKIRKTIKEKGSTPEREKQLIEAQEKANKSVR